MNPNYVQIYPPFHFHDIIVSFRMFYISFFLDIVKRPELASYNGRYSDVYCYFYPYLNPLHSPGIDTGRDDWDKGKGMPIMSLKVIFIHSHLNSCIRLRPCSH